MSNTVVQIQYDEMEKIRQEFSQQGEFIGRVQARIYAQLDTLQQGSWQGSNADYFYTQMNQEVLPGIERMKDALGEASDVVAQIINIFANAEQEGGGIFGGDGGLGGGGNFNGEAGHGGGGGSSGGFGNSGIPLGGGWTATGSVLSGESSSSFTFGSSGEFSFGSPHPDSDGFSGSIGFNAEAEASGSVLSGQISNGTTTFSGDVLQGSAGVSAGIGFDPKNAQFEAHVGGEVEGNLLRAGVTSQIAGVDVAAEARIGANADAKAEVVFDPKTGTFGAGVQAGAFAGGEISGSAGIEGDIGGVEVNGSLRYGIGAEYSGSIGFENGTLHFKNVKAGLAFGVGGSVGFDVKLNVFEVGGHIVNAGRSAIDWLF
jgi:WXG100 family type VII secretion target